MPPLRPDDAAGKPVERQHREGLRGSAMQILSMSWADSEAAAVAAGACGSRLLKLIEFYTSFAHWCGRCAEAKRFTLGLLNSMQGKTKFILGFKLITQKIHSKDGKPATKFTPEDVYDLSNTDRKVYSKYNKLHKVYT